MLGKGKFRHKIFLTDFEFSHPFMKGGKHIIQETKDPFSGSLRFCSRTANSKSNISRKDDLESWFYAMVFLVKGVLPWSHVEASSIKEANEEVLRLKTERRDELLLGLPPAFQQLLGSLEDLKFNSAPDYGQLR